MASSEPRISKSQILKAISSKQQDERKAGWVNLHHAIHGGQLKPDEPFVRKVLDHVTPSGDPSVDASMFRAVETLFFATWERQERLVDMDRPDVVDADITHLFLPRGALGSWLWRPFLRRSWIVRLIDDHHRDERAAMTIARRLPFGVFRATQFEEFYPETFTLPLNLNESVRAVAFIGRPDLFFAPGESTEKWKMARARYSFDETAKHVAWPDPHYHCIYESIADVLPPLEHCTKLEGNRLTDYGLIQRHAASVNGESVVVLTIAGSTFAGTYAAARWSAYSLFGDTLSGQPIATPKFLGDDAELEALVQVTATLGADKAKLPPLDMCLCDLRVGGRQWNQKAGRWEQPSPRNIVLVRRTGGKGIHRGIDEVWLDGSLAPLQGAETGRLLVAIGLAASENEGVVTYDSLIQDKEIWSSDPPDDRDSLAAKLRSPKQRYVGQSLQCHSEHCVLTATVHIVTAK
jgi:hypothetical protein